MVVVAVSAWSASCLCAWALRRVTWSSARLSATAYWWTVLSRDDELDCVFRSRWAYPASAVSAVLAAVLATPAVDALALIDTNGLVGTGVPLTWAATQAGVVWSALATGLATVVLWTTRANVLASPWAASSEPASEAALEALTPTADMRAVAV